MLRDDRSGGFPSSRDAGRGGSETARDRSLLEGTVGIGLALLRSITPEIEPRWERLLGLSVVRPTV
jgi:hypothetical protein